MKLNEFIEITNEDNLELMSRFPDNYFDLAIVDPPYGVLNKTKRGAQRSPHKYKVRAEEWDKRPDVVYFFDLMRVSKNQIVWGGNYFTDMLLPTQSWIFWNKHQPVNNYAKGELAWNSFDKPMQLFDYMYYGNVNSDKNRFHPTQKPVKLYEWLFKHYSKPNQKILDTHLGSGSIAIALNNMNTIEKMNLTLTACELDQEYYEKAVERIKNKINQLKIF